MVLADLDVLRLLAWLGDLHVMGCRSRRIRIVHVALAHRTVLSLDELKDDISVVLSGDAGHLIVEAGGRVHSKRRLRHGLLPFCERGYLNAAPTGPGGRSVRSVGKVFSGRRPLLP